MGHRRRVQIERPHHSLQRVSQSPDIYEQILTSLSGPYLRFKPRTMQKVVPGLEKVTVVSEKMDELRPALQNRSITVV